MNIQDYPAPELLFLHCYHISSSAIGHSAFHTALRCGPSGPLRISVISPDLFSAYAGTSRCFVCFLFSCQTLC